MSEHVVKKGQPLSRAEKPVFNRLVNTSDGYKAIARYLDVTRRTIHFHVSRILVKKDCASRLDLILKHYKLKKKAK